MTPASVDGDCFAAAASFAYFRLVTSSDFTGIKQESALD